MPTVNVRMIAGRSAEQKRACGEAIARAMAEHCGARFEKVYVTFEDVPAENWIFDGRLVAEREAEKHAAAAKAGGVP